MKSFIWIPDKKEEIDEHHQSEVGDGLLKTKPAGIGFVSHLTQRIEEIRYLIFFFVRENRKYIYGER